MYYLFSARRPRSPAPAGTRACYAIAATYFIVDALILWILSGLFHPAFSFDDRRGNRKRNFGF